MHETQRHIETTEAMRFSAPTGPQRRSRKHPENIMVSFKTLAALALLSVTTSTPTFSTTLQGQPGYNYVSSGAKRARVGSNSWCLHNYSADEFDCSYTDRSQCAATAAGGLGQCEPNPFR